MNSAQTHDPSQSETFTCPICLVDKIGLVTANDNDSNRTSDVRTNTKVDESGHLIFQLSSCSHNFCAACLRAYVRSKLLDGQIDVPCCHFKMSSPEEEGDFHQCNVLIEESDIYQLMNIVMVVCEESTDEWYARKITENRHCASKDMWNEDKVGGDDELWKKYQKLKFDLHHGKDAVRRCPKCDDAQIFDHESMKQYQAKFLTQNEDPATSAANNSGDVPTGRMNLMERMLACNRQRRPNITDVMISSDVASEEGLNVAANNPAPEQESNMSNTSVKSLVDVNPALSSSADKKEDDCISQYRGSATSSENNDDDEDRRGTSCDAGADETCQIEAKQSEPSAHHISTTPCVTCLTCSADFCYFHSNAHSSGCSSCIKYHKNSVELDRANLEYANTRLRAKPCPNCGIAVSKEGGCNQIKCGSCGTHFCWICCAVVDAGAFPEHFRWWNVTGCANMQLDESNEPMRCTLLGAKTLSIFQLIVLGIPAVVLTLLSIIVCPCVVLGCGTTNRERVVNFISFWGSFLSSLFLFPFTCLGLLIISAVYCFVAGLKFLVKIVKRSRSDSSDVDVTVPSTVVADDFIRDILDRMEEGRSSIAG